MEYNNDYELIYLIKEDNEEALNLMFNKYEPLIRKIASHYYLIFKSIKIDYEDLIQEGRIGLFEAIKNYKLKREVLFYTYAIVCIKGRIISFLKKQTTNKNIVLSTSYSIEESNLTKEPYYYEEPLELIEDSNYFSIIIRFKNSLDFIDSNIFELRYNFFSYEEIANLLNIKIKDVDNRIYKIKKKLRKYILEIE